MTIEVTIENFTERLNYKQIFNKKVKKKLICYCFLKIFYSEKKSDFGIVFFGNIVNR